MINVERGVEKLIFVDGVISALDFETLGPVFCNIDLTSVLDMGLNANSPDNSIQVWVLMKKRIVLLQHEHGQFQTIQSITLPDTPIQLAWSGHFLYLQWKDKLVQYSDETGSQTGEMKFGTKVASPCEMRVMDSEWIAVNTTNDILYS